MSSSTRMQEHKNSNPRQLCAGRSAAFLRLPEAAELALLKELGHLLRIAAVLDRPARMQSQAPHRSRQ